MFGLMFHLIGDFYLQNEKMSRLKKENNKVLLLHAILYSLPFVLFFFATKVNNPIGHGLLFILFHYIVDKLKIYVGDKLDERIIFVVDQLLHFAVAFTFIYSLVSFPMVIATGNHFLSFLAENVKLIILLLLIFKPCNIIFMVMFKRYRPNTTTAEKLNGTSKSNKEYDLRVLLVSEDQDDTPDSTSIDGAGAIIGSLERALIIALILTNNLSLIGFVLGIKSFARFEMISKSRSLSEYYIIGTLYSYAYTFILYYLLIVI